MPLFYLHLRDSADELLDAEGIELADLEAVRAKVLTAARDIISGDVKTGIIDLRYRIDAENQSGEVIYSLPFRHAFNLIPEIAAA